MTNTPSLQGRILATGIASIALVLTLVGAFVYASVKDTLEGHLEQVLAARLEIARELSHITDMDELVAALEGHGVPAVITAADGRVHVSYPLSRQGVIGLASPESMLDREFNASRSLQLDDGRVVTVLASRAGVEASMRALLAYFAAGAAIAFAVSMLLMRIVTRLAMEPLTAVVNAAHRTAAGERGQRLRPLQPHTPLGQMALAYDEMLDSLETALAAAEDAQEQTRRFVDDAAHQLRTPLAAIRATIEAILHEPDPDIRDRLMANLLQEAARSHQLVSSLLKLAQIDRDTPPVRTPTDVVALCRDEIGRAQSLAPSLSVECEPGPAVAGMWRLDSPALREILSNLLDNARRYAHSTITMAAELIPPAELAEQPMLEFRIRDDGPGVDDDKVERIFDRFSTFDEGSGSGLGLAIARGLARAQGGDLFFDGSAFVLQVPAELVVVDPVTTTAAHT